MLRVAAHIGVFCFIGVFSGIIFGTCSPINGKDDVATLRIPYPTTRCPPLGRGQGVFLRHCWYIEDAPVYRDRGEIRWYFKPGNLPNNVTEMSMRSLIKEALKNGTFIPTHTFHEVSSLEDADLTISFKKPIPKAKYYNAFDETMVTQGFAFSGSTFKGHIHINSKTKFSTTGEPGTYDLFKVLSNELEKLIGQDDYKPEKIIRTVLDDTQALEFLNIKLQEHTDNKNVSAMIMT